MPEPKPREEAPCTFCGDLTRERYSFDMDLPALPFCNRICAVGWSVLQQRPIRGEGPA